MSVQGNIIIAEFPYGNPRSLGEPLGLWLVGAVLTGDATGGTAILSFRARNPTDTPTLPDARRQYVYFCDGIRMSADADPGNTSAQILMHMARANAAVTPPFTVMHADDPIDDGTRFTNRDPIVTPQMARMPVFWDTQELAAGNSVVIQLDWENNVNLANYSGEAYGRYYDRQILGNRGFGRLVAPPAISQFEG